MTGISSDFQAHHAANAPYAKCIGSKYRECISHKPGRFPYPSAPCSFVRGRSRGGPLKTPVCIFRLRRVSVPGMERAGGLRCGIQKRLTLCRNWKHANGQSRLRQVRGSPSIQLCRFVRQGIPPIWPLTRAHPSSRLPGCLARFARRQAPSRGNTNHGLAEYYSSNGCSLSPVLYHVA